MGDDPTCLVKGSEGTMRELIAVINVECKIHVNALGFGTLYALQVMKPGR